MQQDLLDQLYDIEALIRSGEINDGINQLEQLSKEYPENYYVVSLLGECYLTAGKPNEAIKPLKWATKTYHKSMSEEENISEKEDGLIVKLRNHSTDKNKKDLWVDHYLLGCAYARCMKFRNAIQQLNIADKMNPNNGEIIRNIGWIRCMQDKICQGRKLLRKAISIDPNNALSYNDLGASYLFEENLEEAEKWINKALLLSPDDTFITNTADKLEEIKALRTIFT